MKDSKDAIVEKILNDVSQEVSYKVGDIVMGYPAPPNIVALAALQSIVTASLPTMSKKQRKIFDAVLARTTVVSIPPSMDPRKKGGPRS